MSRSKRQERTKRPRSGLPKSDMFDIAGMGHGEDLDVDDADLEAELAAILGTSVDPADRRLPGGAASGGVDRKKLDSMIATSLRDQPSGDEDDDDLEDDDPSLLAELSELTGEVPSVGTQDADRETADSDLGSSDPAAEERLTLLKGRLDLYIRAEGIARQNNDISKARRYKRGLDQLKVLVKRAEHGGDIDEQEIPVEITVPKVATEADVNEASSDDRRPTVDLDRPSSQWTPENKAEVLATLRARRDKYKAAAVAAKRNSDIEAALSFVKIIKRFEVILEAVEKEEAVDLTSVPLSPVTVPGSEVAVGTLVQPETLPSTDETTHPVPPEPSQTLPPVSSPVEELTVLGALESRLAKYLEQEEKAKQEDNKGKVRRMGRIVGQYREAIALYKRGKPIPVDELPTPPGFPPIPVEGGGVVVVAAPADGGVSDSGGSHPEESAGPEPTPVRPSPGLETPTPLEADKTTPSRPGDSPSASQKSSPPSRGGTQTRNERQLALLLLRQREYKEAALKAKQAGDLVKAKEYLRQAKGFDSVIEASRSGLPIDMDTLPRPVSKKSPELDSFEVIRISDCVEGSDSDIFQRLITDLTQQLKMCLETGNHFKAIGDVANANRFENLASDTRKDLNTVRGAHITSSPPPKFHYQQRTFSIVRCNVDLNDNDLELSIIKGINYNVPNPKEIDTYVRYEFPYPNDEVKSEKTSTVYNTNNPEYNTVFTIPILRGSRAMLRIFKRHSLKLHVWSKGGFLRSDQLVATAQVKLQPLETKCSIHDAFDLMDGRKPLGGKLEVKLRVRNPVVSKQIEQVAEKWLVID